jgi:hypothetical protein
MENLARYIIRACFSQERMTYVAANVLYTSKDGKRRQTFEDNDWLAQLVTHIPNRYESRRRRDPILRLLQQSGPWGQEEKGYG